MKRPFRPEKYKRKVAAESSSQLRERECKMSERPLNACKMLAFCDAFRMLSKSEIKVA